MNQFLTMDFWFNPRPEALSPHNQSITLIIAIVVLIVGISTNYNFFVPSLKKHLTIIKKFSTLLITNSLVLFYMWFLNNQIVPILRAWAWFGFFVLIDIAWIIYIIFSIRNLLKRRINRSREAEIKKYIP